MGVSSLTRFKNILVTYMLTFLLIGVCFAIIYLVTLVKLRIKNNEVGELNFSTNWIRGLSVICSLVITFINSILRFVVRRFTAMERHETLTNYNLSVAFKLTLGKFINTNIVPIVANLLIASWFSDGGLVSQFFFIILIISFLDPIMQFIMPANFFIKFNRCI
jgi:hypothetical protein